MKSPIKKYVDNPSLSWEERYRKLETHHQEETTWLIAEVEKLRRDRPQVEDSDLPPWDCAGTPVTPRTAWEAYGPGAQEPDEAWTVEAKDAEEAALQYAKEDCAQNEDAAEHYEGGFLVMVREGGKWIPQVVSVHYERHFVVHTQS